MQQQRGGADLTKLCALRGRPQEGFWVRRCSAGVTLIEVLVAMGLLALILGLLVQVLLPGLRIWKQARALADLEQQCMVAQERIALAVMTTVGSSIRSVNNPDMMAISMLAHGGTASEPGYLTDTGNPRWKRVEVFYARPTDAVLYQTFWDGSGPSLPYDFADGTFRLAAGELTTLAASSGQGSRRLADRVTNLSLTPGSEESPPVAGEGFVLRLALTAQLARGQKTVERTVFLVPRLRERR